MEFDYIPTDLLEQAVRRFELQTRVNGSGKQRTRDGRVITISRLYGAGAEEIVPMVGEQLDWMVWDDQIVELLASEAHRDYQMRMFKALDEKAQNRIDGMLAVFCDRDPAETYLQLLPTTLHTIAAHDAIIVGRAAHLFLPNSLRVLIKAPRERRIAYAMQKNKKTKSAAEKEVKHQDRNRRRFLREMTHQYGAVEGNSRKEVQFDIELNTGSISFENTANIITSAVRGKFGM